MRVRANFKKTFIFIFTLALAAVSFSLIAYAHSGRTDANGGHYDQNTGERSEERRVGKECRS